MRQTKIPGFHELNREPCPICGHKGWCMQSNDGEKVVCTRTPSEIKFGDKGAGWLHTLNEQHRMPAPSLPRKHQPVKMIDWADVVKQMMQNATTPRVAELADSLGVSRESLRRLGVGYSGSHNAFAFPMRDLNGNVVGVRLRTMDGSKFAIPGSRDGLFIGLNTINDVAGPLVICEGPTDCAALLDLGFCAVGRPSCRGAEQMCVDLARISRRDVVIAANYDEAKKRLDGSVFYPGQDGAIALAEKMNRPVKIIYPPRHKDFRAWINAIATRATIDLVINNAGWFAKGAA